MLLLIAIIIGIIGTALIVYFTEYSVNGTLLYWTIPLYILGLMIGVILLFILFIWIYSLIFISRKKKYEMNDFKAFITWLAAQFVCNIFRVKVITIDKDKMPESNQALIVSNHQSILDPLIMISLFRKKAFSFIMKQEVLSYPAVGRWLYGCGFIPLDRDNNRNGLESIVLASKKVAKGNAVCVFPEGTRNKNGSLIEFRPGVFKIAQRSKSPIVVTVIDNVYRAKKRFPFRSTKVLFKVVEVIPYEEIKDQTTQEIAQRVHKLMADSLEEFKNKYDFIGK